MPCYHPKVKTLGFPARNLIKENGNHRTSEATNLIHLRRSSSPHQNDPHEMTPSRPLSPPSRLHTSPIPEQHAIIRPASLPVPLVEERGETKRQASNADIR